jgi:membrane associated rhomboid family serine protease
MFLHAGLMHLAFNMIALYFFGPRLEARLGGRRFLTLYTVSGLVAAITSLLTPNAAIVGASGAVYGIMLGFARYWPREQIYIWGVLPVTARWLVIAMTVLSLWGGLSGAGRGVAHFAHLGGFLGGLIYLVWFERRSPAARFRARAAPGRPSGATAMDVARWAAIRPESLHPVNRDEVERLLRKLAAGGRASALTPDERAFLDRMSGP